MKRTLLIACLALIAVTLLPAGARAGSDGVYRPEDVAQVEILPGWRMQNGHHMAALRVRLADGWKTYWRAPGEAGIPPSFDWRGSKNIAAVRLHWPTPEVVVSNGMHTVGYTHELVLPMEFTPQKTGAPIRLSGRISMGVCEEVCMPMDASFRADLPAKGGAGTSLIEQALARAPETGREAGLRRANCDIAPIADGLRVTARLDMPSLGGGEYVVMEPPDQAIWVSAAQVSRKGRELTATAEMVPPNGKPFLLSRSDLVITVLAQGRAVEIRGCTGS